MRGADASAGTIKSGGKTRRAAKMVILNADHPDIEEFIWCKAIEERKARVLRDAGFDMDLDGNDSHSIQYQNANNSVRVTDEFMQAVVDDADWDLERRHRPARSCKTVQARDLVRQIAAGGVGVRRPRHAVRHHDQPLAHRAQHRPHQRLATRAASTCTSTTRRATSPVINLLKFLDDDGSFDVEGFKHTVEVDVHRAGDPRRQRRLPDRDDRRDQPRVPPARPRLRQPRRAADGARACPTTPTRAGRGPAAHHRADDRPRLRHERPHRRPHGPVRRLRRERASTCSTCCACTAAEAAKIDEELVPRRAARAPRSEAWDDAVELGEAYGVRNSQATVLAPTGTIGLMMDCDTTGIEPDLGLVQGRRSSSAAARCTIVNQTVPRALRRLGYTAEQVDDDRRLHRRAQDDPRRAAPRRPSTCRCSPARWATTRSTTWATCG